MQNQSIVTAKEEKITKNREAMVTYLNAYRNETNQCKSYQESLSQSLAELEDIKYALNQAAIVAIVDPQGKINYVNDKFCEISGYSTSELLGQNYNLLNSGYHPLEFFSELWLTISSGKVWKGEIRDKAKDGSIYWVNTTIVPFLDERGKPWQYLTIQFNISDRKQVEEALTISRNQYQNLVNFSPVGLFRTTVEGKFLEVNERWCELTGMTEDVARGWGWLKTIQPQDRDRVLAEWLSAVEKQLPLYTAEYRLNRADDLSIWVFAQMVAETSTQGALINYVGTITDITKSKQAEERLRYNALYDSLTGLPNRELFLQRLEGAIERSKKFQELFAVLFLDLNRFKVVNDSLGHLVGDKLLQQVGERLTRVLRSKDTVARLGGDEFTIILEKIHDLDNALIVANRIKKQLEHPFYLEDHQIFTGASIGIVLCGSPELANSEQWWGSDLISNDSDFPYCLLPSPITFHEKPEDILRAADTAMYRAKELGDVTRYVVFNPQMYYEALTLLHLENDLRLAVETCQEFVLHYQPICSLATGKISGFEALVRWLHPTRGLVSPSEFIPLAEETGLIIPLGKYVLHQAALQLRKWQLEMDGEIHLTMSVNLSPKQFSQSDLVEQIDQILQDVGLEASCLNLEITESTLMEDTLATTQMLTQLKQRGISLSIDDFGTGYSSLSHLMRFPLNTLKIDRSFIKQMGEEGKTNSSMVSAIITLAHNLGLDVVAEGVETSFQLGQLQKIKCEKAQGYYFSYPLEAQCITDLLNSLTE